MKTIAIESNRRTLKSGKAAKPAYPNAADRRYYLHKLLDGLLALATVVGTLTALIFLLLL